MIRRIIAGFSALLVSLLITTPAHAAGKGMHGVPAGPGMFSTQATGYWYAGIRQSITTPNVVDGFSMNMTVHGPITTNGCPDHSLGEISVQKDGSRDGVVEVGYLGGNCGSTTAPILFVSRWTNSVWGGSYVGSGDGFVKCTVALCGALPVIAAGGTLTSGSSIKVYVQHTGGAWWIWANTTTSATCTGTNCWVGYYPDSVWSGASPAVTFTTTGLVQAFGEVTNDDTTDGQPGVCSNMGTKTGSGVSGNPSLGPPVVGASMGTPQFYGTSIPTVDMNSYVITNSAWYNMLPILNGTRTVAMAYGGGGQC